MAGSSYSGGIAERYATAVFEIAREGGAIDALAADLDKLQAALNESEDLRALLNSPIYTREEQERGIGAVASAIGLGGTLSNTLRLMATKRRLFAAGELVRALRARIADERGEVTAEVTTAKSLTAAQRGKLAETLSGNLGRDVNIDETVDPGIIGGLIVRVGSKMIDTSIRSKLGALQNTMKEAG
ncbi:ATP synthase F1 subcomplex delta subunit [Hasllibacter halocynthiae]|uniref:ATP synthase subunit delta n=1 Tax=Hasllibacter halocynthiae TaxID=595589 RepID=A0A2T0X0Y2_9RHOB|nr:F0F1 ATP synthase subunit delta [Hasllibacter halocynthiae]PRY92613.1 ATP synthase F1 subcomplex delta subunit [Hasllibacter halocynthiae]